MRIQEARYNLSSARSSHHNPEIMHNAHERFALHPKAPTKNHGHCLPGWLVSLALMLHGWEWRPARFVNLKERRGPYDFIRRLYGGLLSHHLVKHDLIVATHSLLDNNKATKLGIESTINQIN